MLPKGDCQFSILGRHTTRKITTTHKPTTMSALTQAKNSYDDILLDTNVQPIQYNLTFDVDLENFVVQAEAEIALQIKGPGVNVLVLHSLDLGIDGDSVLWSPQDGSGRRVLSDEVSTDKQLQTVNFPFHNGPPLSGKGTLSLRWNFMLTDNLCGFYRSKYIGLDGSTRYMATTQFEATDARRAFPCVDEPAAKAVFVVTLIIPADRVGISNMPMKEKTSRKDGRVMCTYEPTPVMSTYILAFVVGEFDHVSVLTDNGVRTTVYTPKGKTALGKHALFVASRALPFFEEKFGIKYPLPKSDLLAIPDFAAGAMENWGCVTYRETRLLIDPENTPLANTIACSRTVSHELAHMWFGNLVTMKWWTDLWLNEGFARFMEFLALDSIFPEWSVWRLFVQSVQTLALNLDALESSHPVQVDVSHPDEINEIFDTISYAKGASVLRMLYSFIGEELFLSGVKNYLNKYAYANGETKDLWNEIAGVVEETKSTVDIVKMMSLWTQAQGYPVLIVEERETKSNGDRQFVLTQQRFGLRGAEYVESSTTVWHIPIGVMCESEQAKSKPVKVVVMDKKSLSVDISQEAPGFVRFNAGQLGFFRCCYTEKSDAFLQLLEGVKKKTLPPEDRLGFLSDMFACSKFGFCPIGLCLDLAACFDQEDTLAVIQELGANLGFLLSIYSDDDEIVAPLRSFTAPLFTRLGDELGWEKKEGENSTDTIKRATVIGMLIHTRNEATVAKAKELFAKRDSCNIDKDLKSLVYRTAMKEGTEETYKELKVIYECSDLADEKRRAFTSMGAASDPALQRKTLVWALLSGEVRNQDVPMLVASVSRSKRGGKVCWEFFKENFDQIEANFSAGQSFLLSGLVSACTSNLKTEEDICDVNAFFDEHPMPSAARAIKKSVEKIKLLSSRRARESKPLLHYLQSLNLV